MRTVDYYAAAALRGLISSPTPTGLNTTADEVKVAVHYAERLAAAMCEQFGHEVDLEEHLDRNTLALVCARCRCPLPHAAEAAP